MKDAAAAGWMKDSGTSSVIAILLYICFFDFFVTAYISTYFRYFQMFWKFRSMSVIYNIYQLYMLYIFYDFYVFIYFIYFYIDIYWFNWLYFFLDLYWSILNIFEYIDYIDLYCLVYHSRCGYDLFGAHIKFAYGSLWNIRVHYVHWWFPFWSCSCFIQQTGQTVPRKNLAAHALEDPTSYVLKQCRRLAVAGLCEFYMLTLLTIFMIFIDIHKSCTPHVCYFIFSVHSWAQWVHDGHTSGIQVAKWIK